MAAIFLAKRHVLNIRRASPSDYSCCVQCVDRVTTSRCFTHGRKTGAEESEESSRESITVGKEERLPRTSTSYATNTAKEELERAAETASKESGRVAAAGGEDNGEEDVAVGETGKVKGENQLSS